jgi:hypothetical protein
MMSDEAAAGASHEAVTLPEDPDLSQAACDALAAPSLFAPLRDSDFLYAAACALLEKNDWRGLWDLDYWCKELKEGRLEAVQRALAGGDATVISHLLAAQACVLKNTPRPFAALQ